MTTATVTNNNLVVSGISDKEVKGTLVVNVKYGVNSTNKTDGFSCTFEKNFSTRVMTSQEKVEKDLALLFGDGIKYPTEITLPETGNTDVVVTVTPSKGSAITISVKVKAAPVTTSKVSMAKGTTAYDDVTVNGMNAIKCGSSSAAGTMTITAKAGVTKIEFYAGSWNNADNAKITVSGGATPTSIDIAKCSQFSGSGKTFTGVTGTKCTLTISASETDTVITLTSSVRFFVWDAKKGTN